MVDCNSLASMPDVSFNIAGKKFSLTPEQVKFLPMHHTLSSQLKSGMLLASTCNSFADMVVFGYLPPF